MRIGGHEGLDVLRKGGRIIKRGHNVEYSSYGHPIDNAGALRNEAKFLRVMKDSGFTPELLSETTLLTGWVEIEQTDVGDTEVVQDGEAFRRNCVRLLHEIRQRDVRHGDLKGSNIIIRGDWPWAVDWQEAHFLGEPASQKQPFSDSWLLWGSVAGTLDREGEFDIPRVARRWQAVIKSLGAADDLGLPLAGKTLLDLGCSQGDFCAMAACENMQVVGIDHGGFRSGENSIEQAQQLWASNGNMRFKQMNIADVGLFDAEVVLLFSTWSYIVQDFGRRSAENLLGKIISDCRVLFFENQLWGDGPGPNFFQNDGDIQRLLDSYGKSVEKLVSISVGEREAMRTVWRVG